MQLRPRRSVDGGNLLFLTLVQVCRKRLNLIRFCLRRQMIRNCTFIHERDRLQLIRLSATVIFYIGAPEYMNEEQTTEYNIKVGRNYFQNLLMIRRARAVSKLLTFARTSEVTSRLWHHAPSAVSGQRSAFDF